jgi:hypothetical protein
MIQVQDLMIGNYIKWKDNGSIFEITIDLFFDKYFCNHLNKGHFEPIILSEEILLKCGFEKLAETEYTINTYELDNVRVWVNNGKFFVLSLFHINYLHELQQLYKILTKQELEIKW